MGKSNSYLLKSEKLTEEHEDIGKSVVVTVRKRIQSISDIIQTPAFPRYENVQVAAVVVGGTIKTYQEVTPSLWPWQKPHVAQSVVKIYAVKTTSDELRLVAEEDSAFVYNVDIWLSDSKKPSAKKPKAPAKKPAAKSRKVKVVKK